MANRYWVGWTWNWDNTDTTHWSDSSWWVGWKSVPNATDNVYIDSNSWIWTITITTNWDQCLNLDFTGYSWSINFNWRQINCYWDLIMSPTMSFSSPQWYDWAIKISWWTTIGRTIKTNWLTMWCSIAIDLWVVTKNATLLDDLIIRNDRQCVLRINSWTFNTGNYNISCFSFDAYWYIVTPSVINLWSSQITCQWFNVLEQSSSMAITMNAWTSTINITSNYFYWWWKDYYNIVHTPSYLAIFSDNSSYDKSTIWSIYNLTWTATYWTTTSVYGSWKIKVTWTFTASWVSPTNRLIIWNESQVIDLSNPPILTNVSFRWTTIIWSASPVVVDYLTKNLWNNTWILFRDPPKNQSQIII